MLPPWKNWWAGIGRVVRGVTGVLAYARPMLHGWVSGVEMETTPALASDLC